MRKMNKKTGIHRNLVAEKKTEKRPSPDALIGPFVEKEKEKTRTRRRANQRSRKRGQSRGNGKSARACVCVSVEDAFVPFISLLSIFLRVL